MSQKLNFAAVTNNDVVVQLSVTRKSDGSLVDLTGYYIKVSGFFPGTRDEAFSYSTADGDVVILNQTTSKGQAQFTIEAEDSIDFSEGDYPWDGVTVSPDSINLNIRNDDLNLSPGVVSFTRQLTVQP